MATIELNTSKINAMEGLITQTERSVKRLKTELTKLNKKALKVDNRVCNVEDVAKSLSTATKTQEDKLESLKELQKNIDKFVELAVKKDRAAKEKIETSKDDFYKKYDYLKPDSEKGWLYNTIKKASDWCKEHWKSLLNVFIAIVITAAIIAVCIVTFGAAAVLLAIAVGVATSLAAQLISDCVSWGITGEADFKWQSYVGAAVGGAAGGALSVSGVSYLSPGVEGFVSTLMEESLLEMTGDSQKSNADIWLDSFVNAGTAIILDQALGKISNKLSKSLSKKIPSLSRLSGTNSFAASYKSVITRLSKKSISRFTIKSVRNGVMSKLIEFTMEGIIDGIGLKDYINRGITTTFKDKSFWKRMFNPILPPVLPPIIQNYKLYSAS